jgi:hypothetical protein
MIIKVCKKHGDLNGSQCYFIKKYKRYLCKLCTCTNRKKNVFCHICNNSFFANRDAKYCSKECLKKARDLRIENKNLKKIKINCKNCQKIFFYEKWGKKIFCSFECSMEFKTVKNRICQHCNKEFIPCIRSHKRIQKYCSVDCNKKQKSNQTKKLLDTNRWNCPTHGIMNLDNFLITKSKNYKYGSGFRYSCRMCNKTRSNIYREKNNTKICERKKFEYANNTTLRQKIKERQKIWKQEKKHLVKANAARYRIKNKEKINQKRKMQIAELKPYYVKACMLTKLPIDQVPKELIDVKRIYMKIRRKLKELKHGHN